MPDTSICSGGIWLRGYPGTTIVYTARELLINFSPGQLSATVTSIDMYVKAREISTQHNR